MRDGRGAATAGIGKMPSPSTVRADEQESQRSGTGPHASVPRTEPLAALAGTQVWRQLSLQQMARKVPTNRLEADTLRG